MYSKDNDKECFMHWKSANMKIIINDKANKEIENIFPSFLSRYQMDLETTMKGSNFILDHVHLLYFQFHT